MAYGGTTLPVIGTVILRVWRDHHSWLLNCKLVDYRDIRPLLGRKACVGMKIISYLDSDSLNKPDTGDGPVYVIEEPLPLSIKQLIQQYPTVFSNGVGRLEC